MSRLAVLAVRHERLRVVRGDVLDPPSLTAAVDGADAVVSALGGGGRWPTSGSSSGG